MNIIAKCTYVFGSGDINCYIDPGFVICSLILLVFAIGIEIGSRDPFNEY